MTFEEIRDELKNLAPEPSFSDLDYNNVINDVQREVCAKLLIPELKRITTVQTVLSTQYVSLSAVSSGFSGLLRRVRNASNSDEAVTIYRNLDDLFEFYGTAWGDSGTVESVALEGSTLWYAYVPNPVQTLTILYTANPTALSVDSDIPIFPSFLHRKLLVNGSARVIWNLIETDIATEKIQTNANEYHFEKGLQEYREFLGKNRRHSIISFWDV